MRFLKFLMTCVSICFLYACSDKPADKTDDSLHPSFSELPEIIEESDELSNQGVVPLKLSLKDQEMADNAPSMIKEGVSKEESEELKGKLEEAGATVTLK